MNNEIKDCPKCKSSAMMVCNSRDLICIVCADNVECDFSTYEYLPSDEAIDNWNKRVSENE